mmetsp:Transcript_163823/g.525423  ORF Transcript_163823/g.525423 Transcript_163823/m.525423 type:complete len:267 (+) Transcript_163823:999-1799(+)
MAMSALVRTSTSSRVASPSWRAMPCTTTPTRGGRRASTSMSSCSPQATASAFPSSSRVRMRSRRRAPRAGVLTTSCLRSTSSSTPRSPANAYIGFIRPNVGAILPMAELQAMWWCEKLEGKLTCKAPDYYKLKGSRLSYGVDYGNYMFALAREMGAVPSLLHWLFRRPKVAIAAGFGQAHVPIFRLQGPFASKEAEETCATELFGQCMKRPFMMNLIFFFEAIGFGVLNGVIGALSTKVGQVLAVAGAGLGLAMSSRGDVLRSLRK